MLIRTADSTRLYQQVVQQIEGRIRDGSFAVGSRLPAERELISLFGVSRSVLREALIALELKGLVEIRVGSGTFVLRACEDIEEHFDAHILDDATGFDILFARRLVECETARLAALSRTRDDLGRIKAALDQMERDTEPFMLRHVADRAFHAAIAEATRNPVLVFTVSVYWDRYRRFVIRRVSATARQPGNRDMAIADHRTIYQCIADRDAAGAAAAMNAHLERVGWFLSSFHPRDEAAKD
jgi:DNA-binding FadR family transcriptional regulator